MPRVDRAAAGPHALPVVDRAGFHRVGELEMACGWVPGRIEAVAPSHASSGDPVSALEALLGPALAQTPCVIGFSGGRDSSLVLAIALRLARREGLPEPVAATKIYPHHPETDESAWQELVVRHLGVTEWVRQPFDDGLDLLGPAARDSLRTHGVLWPATCHNRAPHLALARGGSYVGGEGGDEVLGELRPRAWARVIAGVDRQPRRVLKAALATFGPKAARRTLYRRSPDAATGRPWLRPDVAAWFRQALMEDHLDEPLTFGRAVLAQLDRHAVVVALGNLHAIGRSLDVNYSQPLASPIFATALGRAAGTFGFADRTAAMRALAADLLPDAVLARETKAGFNRVYAGRHTRDFIERWNGGGVRPDLIDVDALRAAWQEPVIHGGTFQLLHQGWLAEGS